MRGLSRGWSLVGRAALDESPDNPRLVGRWPGRENGDEALPGRSLVVVRVDVEVAVLRVEVGVGAVAEVAEVAAGDADVAVDDPRDLAVRQAARHVVASSFLGVARSSVRDGGCAGQRSPVVALPGHGRLRAPVASDRWAYSPGRSASASSRSRRTDVLSGLRHGRGRRSPP